MTGQGRVGTNNNTNSNCDQGASAPANPAKQLTNFLDKRQKIMRFIAAAGKKSIIDTKDFKHSKSTRAGALLGG